MKIVFAKNDMGRYRALMKKYLSIPIILAMVTGSALGQTSVQFSDVRDQVIFNCNLLLDMKLEEKSCQTDQECRIRVALQRLEEDGCSQNVDRVIAAMERDPNFNPSLALEDSKTINLEDPLDSLLAFMLTNELISQNFEDADAIEDFDFSPKRHLRPTTPTIRDVDGPPPAPSLTPPTAPRLKPSDIKIYADDRDARPLVRFPGEMPANADRSGRCVMQFDVNEDGIPYNVRAVSCTHKMFELNAVRAVQKFKYRPKIIDGAPVHRYGVLDEIVFRLTDENGNVVPE